MRTIVVTNIVSLDGYYEGPGGNVMALPMDAAFDTYNRERMEAADVLLVGRTSFEAFSQYWPGIEHAPADPDNRALDENNRAISHGWNTKPVVVVSDGYEPPAANPLHGSTTTVARDAVRAWKEAGPDGQEAQVFASHVMWNGLIEQGLVDELHLMIGNTALGDGTPVFTGPVPELTLLEARTFEGSSNVLLRYAPTGA
jgi:dihydrofolate reductase